jgi:hypothetical protein
VIKYVRYIKALTETANSQIASQRDRVAESGYASAGALHSRACARKCAHGHGTVTRRPKCRLCPEYRWYRENFPVLLLCRAVFILKNI